MGMDKTIGISIDNNRLRQDANTTGRIFDDLSKKISSASSPQAAAQDLFSSFATKARGYTTSAPEMMRSMYEQQKTLFDQRARTFRSAISGAETRYKEGKLPKEAFEDIRSGYRSKIDQDKLILNALRDIRSAIVTTAKEEIVEDRKNVEESIRKSTTVGRYIKAGDDPYSAVKQTLQQRMLGDLTEEERQQKGINLGGVGRGITNIGGHLVRGDIGGAAASGGRMAVNGMSGVGVAGGIGLGAIAALLLGGAWAFMENKNIARDLREYSVTTGTPTDKTFGILKYQAKEGHLSRMGLTAREAMQEVPGYIKAYGGELPENEIREILGLSRSRNVSKEQIGSMLGVNRYSKEGGSSIDIVASLEKYLVKNNQSIVRLGEIMGSYGNIANRYIQTTGSFSSTKLMAGITGLGQSFGVQGVNLDRFAAGFQGAFSRSENPQIQALQFRAMAEAMPGASLWQMQTAMNKPLENVGYVNNLKGMVERMYKGSPDAGKQTLLSMFKPFGLTEENIDQMWGKEYKKGDFNVGKEGSDKVSYAQEAEKFTSASEVVSNKFINGMDILNSSMGVLPEKIADAFNTPEMEMMISSAVGKGLGEFYRKNPNLK